jgi:hypothetical protein
MKSPSEDRIQQWIGAMLDRTREQLRAELGALVREVHDADAAARAEAARLSRAEAEAAATSLVAEARAVEHAAAQDRQHAAVEAAVSRERAEHQRAVDALRAEHERAQAAAVDAVERRAEVDLASAVTFARADERQADLGASSSLVDAIRALDGALSLSTILDALAGAAARHTTRTALLVVRHGELRGWQWSGFDPALGEARALRVDATDDSLVSRAYRTGAAQAASGPASLDTPLAPSSDDRAAAAVPVTVDGEVVAVLYGDDDGGDARQVPSAWPEVLEVMARHAGRCLESMTARRLPAFTQGPLRVETAAEASDEAAAQRYARLLVSEIRLYHEAALEAARREGDILRQLRPQVARAQQLYAERVPERIRARTDYFEQELVRTLAGGDAALLGQIT